MNRAQLRAYQEALADLANSANYDIEQLWRILQFEAADPAFVREALEEALPALVEQYGTVANELSAEWFISLDPSDGYRPVAPPPPPREQGARTAAWAVQPLFDEGTDAAVVLSRLDGAMTRFVYGAGRESIVFNAERLGVPFARVARADGCPFCRMLASRGFVYRDDEAAGGVTADHYHNSCRCVALPKRRGISDLDVPNLSRFRADYYNARSGIDNTTSKGALKEILKNMS